MKGLAMILPLLMMATMPQMSSAKGGSDVSKSTWNSADWLGSFAAICDYTTVSEGQKRTQQMGIRVSVSEMGSPDCVWITDDATSFMFCGRQENEKSDTTGGYNLIRKGPSKENQGLYYNLDFKRNPFKTSQKYRIRYALTEENTLSYFYQNESEDGDVNTIQCSLQRDRKDWPHNN